MSFYRIMFKILCMNRSHKNNLESERTFALLGLSGLL